MKKISIQSLNNFFNFIQEIPSTILWIRDISYNKQLYVSENYEKIWGHSLEKLYNYPQSFDETIIAKDRKIYYDSLKDKIHIASDENIAEEKTYFWRIKKNNSKIIYTKDQHCLLTNNENTPVGFVGFAKLISEQEWLKYAKHTTPERGKNNIEEIKNNVFEILKRELQVYNKNKTTHISQSHDYISFIDSAASKCSVKLTPQEIICLSHLLQGISTKQIASKINISVRTIEFHLENIRKKFCCRTKVQLISKMMHSLQSF